MPDTSSRSPRPDPLIDEIRAIRQKISDEYGNDIRRLGAHLQEFQRQFKDRVITDPAVMTKRARQMPSPK